MGLIARANSHRLRVAAALAFAAYPPLVVLAMREWGLQAPGLFIMIGTIVAAYYGGALIGAIVLIESLVLIRWLVDPYLLSFDVSTIVGTAAVGVTFVFWIDRVLRRERRSLGRSKRAEERFQRIFEGTQVGVIVIDPRTRLIESVNPTFCEISGYTIEETVGRDPAFLMHERSSPVLGTPEMPRLLSGEISKLDRRAVMARPDGAKVFVDIAAVIVTGDDGEPRLAGTVIDRTEYVLAEEQVRRTQKLDAVGRLAGGIAHDFNNLLTVMSGYAELALEKDLPPAAAGDVEAIRVAAERATGLTRQLLAFSRNVVVHPKPVDMNAVVVGLDVMLRRLIEAPISVQTRLTPGLPRAHADEAQLEQVLMNLVLNARDAMPDGGTLTVSTYAVAFEEDDRRRGLLELAPGSYVAVAVTDTGVGMSEEVVDHIFEPFFTTKGEYGTGLGLSTVYGIVHQSRGGIDVASEERKGTTITVYLPVGHVAPPVAAPAAESSRDGGARSARILLVEDEQGVRDLLGTMLRRAGHEVFPAEHPDRALDLVDSGLEVDLLLTDLVLPARSGIELAAEVERRTPGVAVVYMSGQPDDAHGVRPGDDALFVAKPFHAATLLERVDAALSARAAANGPARSGY